ncbi:hypothetical protein PPERSA_03237 [Pseudocohnilembus persalinus]|uniref:Uncharacterized protein n=1 Tax=Pseudocohnilembus persalinus TaxID=266149 RepID=A0A0V0QYL1_PSEPJ|nr:hypothetical protein PPERSA_03237 [Pseudocohnilembus persalinus]|eukprot:KRX07404.1 hypothetical protein PPERSA_03237 [Pseudocohnilembus persalinus]
MDQIQTEPDFDMLEVKRYVENTVWIYKSSGGWNNQKVYFQADGKVKMKGDIMGYWGIQGRALYFQVKNSSYREESCVAIYISQTRIEWLKINYMEHVYMVAEKEN